MDRQDHSNGTTTAFGYDGRGMISSVHHKRVTNGANLSYRDYWRDNRDRITAWKKSSDSIVNPMENGLGDRYAYDEAGQLTAARYQAQNPQGNATSPQRGDDFVYDALGNRKGGNNWVASRGQMLNFTIKENGLNQYSGWWPYNFIKYDDDIGGTWGTPQHANGTIMQEGWITVGYNALNQPIQIMSRPYNGTNNWMWFGFDPLGRCVKRWVSYPGGPETGATYYYYDGWNLLQEGASPASVQRLYIHGARVDEIVKSINYPTGQVAWHHYDGRGHCTMLTGPNGEILEQYDYDAFGFPYFYDGQGNAKTFYDTPSNSVRGYSPYGNRFLFTGREWLTDLKLYDYRNRLYHPELGRFLQPDPKHFAAGDYNLYRYCHNDPINKSDPTGLAPVVIDEETDQLLRDAVEMCMSLSNSNPGWFGRTFEYAISVVQDGGVKRMTGSTTDGSTDGVHPASEPNVKTLVETHNHTYDHSGNWLTKVQLSGDDVGRAIKYGIPVVIRTPKGVWERYRPSDKPTREERAKEGGIIERLQGKKWIRVPGANDDLSNPGAFRNGY